jgi:uncharacterized membrane protein YphA (DoxX/SURF4 family)
MRDLILESYKNKKIPTDLLRMYFGAALFFKGLYFIGNMKQIFSMISYQFPYIDFLFAHYVVLAHIGGGICIFLGLFTRLAALANVPVLLSAIFFVQAKNGVLETGSELELVVMVLALLIYFICEGSGILSSDTYIRRSHEKREIEEKLQRESNRG